MSIRLRLTLIYTVILALTLVVFSTALYMTQSQYTLAIIERDLSQATTSIADGWARLQHEFGHPPPLFWMMRRGGPEEEKARQALQPLTKERRWRDSMRVLNADGILIDLPTNESSPALPLSANGLAQLQRGEVWIEIGHDEEGRLFIYNHPVVFNDEVVGILQMARSLADRDRSLRSLGLTLLFGSVLTTLIAFGVGWTLSGATLRPIHRITQTAREIGEGRDFSSRVRHTGPNDELGRLATTFNEMLSQLQHSYQQVTHALQVQRDFVADVSHELRTPLTTIRGNLALLQHAPPLPQDEQTDVLNDLIGESERLSRLVIDLLTLARADTGRKLALTSVDVNPIVDEVCRQMRLLAPKREIACEHTSPATAQANEDALKQVLLILLDNAVKHAQGPIHLELNTDDHHIAICVRDEGPGISEELQQRIFDRFYRGDVSRSTPGFGLGLSIAQALLAAQQGSLEVTSQAGEGSTFTVRIPQFK